MATLEMQKDMSKQFVRNGELVNRITTKHRHRYSEFNENVYLQPFFCEIQ